MLYQFYRVEMMKITLAALAVAILTLIPTWNVFAQVPEKIYGKNKILKPNEYYLQQITLWKAVLDSNRRNADAWLNYYRAHRNAYVKGEEDNSQKSKGNTRFNRLKSIVDDMETYVPDTYELHFVRWLNGNNNPALFPALDKAHRLKPQNPEPLLALILYYEIQGNYAARNTSIEQYYALGDYSPGLLNYSYNLLAGLDSNAIIFTEGDKDTEAILLLQEGKKFRQDVRMLNVNLLLMSDYRERVFRELGIKQLPYNPLTSEETYEKFRRSIVEHVVRNSKQRPVHTSVTVSSPYTTPIENKLYLTGLSHKYSDKPFDAMVLLKFNIEHLYALDYLRVYFPIDISIDNMHSMNGNYLPALAALSADYRKSGNTIQADYYQNLAQTIATAANLREEFEAYFGKQNKSK